MEGALMSLMSTVVAMGTNCDSITMSIKGSDVMQCNIVA